MATNHTILDITRPIMVVDMVMEVMADMVDMEDMEEWDMVELGMGRYYNYLSFVGVAIKM